MTTTRTAPLMPLPLLLALLLVSSTAAAQEAEEQPVNKEAAQALAEIIAAHRALPAFAVKTTVAVNLMDGDVTARSENKTAEIAFMAPDDDNALRGLVTINDMTCHIQSGMISIVHASNDGDYFSIADDDAPYWILLNVFRDLPFPHLAIGLTRDTGEDMWMQLHPSLPWAVPHAVRTQEADGATSGVLTMASDNGTFDLMFDPKTKMLTSAVATITGGQLVQQGATLSYEYTFTHDTDIANDPAALAARIAFDPGERQRVDHPLALLPKAQPVEVAAGRAEEPFAGLPAPGFVLSTMTGEAVDLEDLRGRVVILDFWATWCAPCVQALPKLHDVARWARDEQLPVDIFAVNVFERADNADAVLRIVTDFWEQRNFSLPVLMDYSNQTAGDYQVQGIPRTVIIRADGIVHTVHVGFNAADPAAYMQMLKDDIHAAIDALEKPPAPELIPDEL